MAGLQAVTGAYGYSGKYIARQLLDAGEAVITLTNSTDRANEFGGHVQRVSVELRPTRRSGRRIGRRRGALQHLLGTLQP